MALPPELSVICVINYTRVSFFFEAESFIHVVTDANVGRPLIGF